MRRISVCLSDTFLRSDLATVGDSGRQWMKSAVEFDKLSAFFVMILPGSKGACLESVSKFRAVAIDIPSYGKFTFYKTLVFIMVFT